MKKKSSIVAASNEQKSSVIYVIECIYCGKIFERPTLDLNLGEHRYPKTGYLCYSNGQGKEIRVAPQVELKS